MHLAETTRFRRRHLPHWEVVGGRYFVTVRFADSLPREAVEKLDEFERHLTNIVPHSAQFAALQREIFRALEKYLDAGTGSCPLRQPAAAQATLDEFSSLCDWHVTVRNFTVMPNHWHALIIPGAECSHSLSAIMKRLKGRTAKRIRHALGGRGPVWQREWFDRWMRNDAEFEKCAACIRNNPVKAGLAKTWNEHPWTL